MHADITYLCIRDYYNTEDGKNEGVVIYDEGSIDSEYEEEDDQVVVLDKYLFIVFALAGLSTMTRFIIKTNYRKAFDSQINKFLSYFLLYF